jgi:hypothetical protein
LALKNFGFDFVQGHIVTKPLSPENLSDWRRNYMPPTAFVDGNTPMEFDVEEDIEEVVLSSIGASGETLDVHWTNSQAVAPSDSSETELSLKTGRRKHQSPKEPKSKLAALGEKLGLSKK